MTITELRKTIGQSLGFGSWMTPFDGSSQAYSELSAEDQVKLTNAMTQYIRENPTAFSAQQVETAKNAGVIEVPKAYTVSEAASDFVAEAASQAASINEAVNPFSESNRGKILWLGLAGFAAYFLLPVIVRSIREGRAPAIK